MSDKPDNQGSTYEELLSNLESRLESHEDSEAMLGDIGMAMRALLSGNNASEQHIRQMLERQFEQGNLRHESYELVEKMLGKIAAEENPPPPEPIADEPYIDTAVLEQPGAETAESVVTNQLQVGTVLRDRFLLKEEVSEGSMGVVYQALDRRLAETGEDNAYVAIKVLSPILSRNGAALRALQQEAAKGRCLAHPNIVRFIDLDRDDELYFIVMEWLEGRSLSSILDDNPGNALDLPTAMDIVAQTARALSYAHQRGVVHADVKPGNIIITPDGQVKLIDFGVARVRQKENEGKSRFDPKVMRAGSPAYSSMQVLTGEDPVPADDVFSLACLMYRLVAGYRVFGPRNAADAAEEGMEPQQPPGLDSTRWQALKKALSYSRVTRFDSPKAFMDALKMAPREVAKKPPKKQPKIPAEEQPKVQSKSIQREEVHTEPGIAAEALPVDEPMRVERESIMYEREEEPRRSPWRLIVVGVIIIASVAVVFETGVIDTLTGIELPLRSASGVATNRPPAAVNGADEIQDLDALPEVDVAETTADDAAENVVEELVIDAADGSVDEVLVADNEVLAEIAAGPVVETTEPPPEPAIPVIDFSLLPPPNVLLSLRQNEAGAPPEGAVIIREDAGNAIVDLVRGGNLSQSFSVQFVEAENSGNRSSWESGQYELENEGLLTFDAGQPRARIAISMLSDPVREADRDIKLSVRDAADPQAELAVINLTLEDDDQRAFEEKLPPNTVAFAVNQISVREFDPAAQIDVIRYKPDNTALEVTYSLQDVTATEGQDYFTPGLQFIYFAPGQRTARILIPLGQDGRAEQDEAFMLELNTEAPPTDSNIFSQIAVMIRDDDS